jgi:hypothetical protein
VTRWQPSLELTRLLEALGEDLVAVTDEEVQQTHGRAVADTAREVRQLINGACAERDEVLRQDLGEAFHERAAVPRPARIFRRPSHHQRH